MPLFDMLDICQKDMGHPYLILR